MKTSTLMFAFAAFLLVVATGVPVHSQESTTPEWPCLIAANGDTTTIYQPQLESWDYSTMTGSAAVSVKHKTDKQATFGTIQIVAKTTVDRAARTVAFDSVTIPSGTFPSAPDQADANLQMLRTHIPKMVKSMSLDRLEASLAILEQREKGSSQPLENTPPAIIFSTKPALLILVDGQPAYRAVAKTKAERVVNTHALLVRDNATLYLHVYDGYLQATGLGGPWTVATKVPGDVSTVQQQAVAAKEVDLLAGQANPDTKEKPSLKTTTPLPVIYIATAPTELIVTTGEAEWTPVESTNLLYVKNTNGHVFKDINSQKTYVLISGRWFASSSFDGPWTHIAGSKLPADFAKIPDTSEVENVKASVPGTKQAQEAAIANDIPQTDQIDRKKAAMDPALKYDGDPRLAAIDGTPLHYVVNCATPVIEVDEKTWYACQNSVWFAATGAGGPWVVATSVPAVIYSIPPGSPLHYVTYVRVYNYDANYVWVGVTPGYYGTMIDPDGVVVYGTGYYYPAYVGTTVYVSYPITYGYGFNACWSPWAGWGFGFAVGWSMSSNYAFWACCPPAPFWGPYWGGCYGAHYNAYGGITSWGPYGWAGTSGYCYSHNGAWSSVSRGAAGYNAWTGNEWASRYGHAYNSVTGTSVAGRQSAVQNVYTGNWATHEQGGFHNAPTGVSGVGSKTTVGNAWGGSATAGHGTVYNPNTGNTSNISGVKGENGGAVNVNNHVIAGNDGNVYRPNGQGGWQQMSHPGGAPAGGAAGQHPGGWQSYSGNQTGSLNQQFGARQSGGARSQSFQANRPSFGGGGGRRR